MTTTVDNAQTATNPTDTLGPVIDDVIRPQAPIIDRDGAFPRPGVDALAAAGLLGLASSTEVGGGGHGMRAVAEVIERLAAECGSTAMVVLMHYAATAVIEAHGPRDVRAAIAAGDHLTTLAFSEYGSRSHFWSPTGTATAADDDTVRLDARKSWVTSAGEVNSYVWSSLPLARDAGPMTLWLVPADSAGLSVTGDFDGLGLRGNGSRPMTADGLRVPSAARMAADGAGLDAALGAVLPWFLVLNAAFCLGLADSAVAEAGASPHPHHAHAHGRGPARRARHPARPRPPDDPRPTRCAPSWATRSPRWRPAATTRCCGCSRSRRSLARPSPT